VKKHKAKWPSKEEELFVLDAELKDFNYKDLDKMDLKGESDDMSDEISNEVTV